MYKEIFTMRLKEAREENRLTQKEVAEKVQTTQSMISQFEKGKREPSLEMIGKLAKVLCVSADYLFGMAQF